MSVESFCKWNCIFGGLGYEHRRRKFNQLFLVSPHVTELLEHHEFLLYQRVGVFIGRKYRVFWMERKRFFSLSYRLIELCCHPPLEGLTQNWTFGLFITRVKLFLFGTPCFSKHLRYNWLEKTLPDNSSFAVFFQKLHVHWLQFLLVGRLSFSG